MLDASLAILNANVITLNSKKPRAKAIAVYENKIIAVGSNKEISKYIGEKTQVIDAKNKTIFPGLIDCHVHMAAFGRILQTLDLRNVDSIEELKQKLREYADKNLEKSWILGGGWDQERFVEKRYPTRWDLDDAVSERPVFLVRVCGHVGVANSKALQMAGITKTTTVEGGRIDLDEASGEPNGILRENALELVRKAKPKISAKELEHACLLACQKAIENGLTGVHWIIDSAEEIQTVFRLYYEGKLPLKVYFGIPVKFLNELTALKLPTGFGNEMVKIGFVKILADGALGARTAALKEPYSDMLDTKGMMLYAQKRLNELVLSVHKSGLQLAVHAIGDYAVESVLKAFSQALKKYPRKDHRHRIEHCSVLNPKLVRSMKRLGIIASVQPHFVVSDFWVVNRVGKQRARWVYPFKTLMSEGIIVASGSDCPVEPINPLLGIWAAVARKAPAEECLRLEEALKTYTLNAAYASFEEKSKGTIEVGKLADLTVLEGDLDKIKLDKIKDIQVKMVIVNGKIVYKR